MKKNTLLVAAVFLTLMLAAQPGLLAGKEPYVIGAFLSISGPNAPLGTPERDTLTMMEDQINGSGGINGRPLRIVIEDDGSDPTNAVKAVKKLLEQDKAVALIGGTGTGSALAAVGIVAQAHRPFLALCAGSMGVTEPVNPWIFRTPQPNKVMVECIVDYLSSIKVSKVAMIYDSNAFGTDGRDKLRLQAAKSNLRIVAEESFNSKDTDFTVQLTKVKNAGAQVIICWGTNPAPAILTKNREQLGITIPLIQSHGVANATYLQLSGDASEGVILPAGKLFVPESLLISDPQRKVLQDYAAAFRSKYGREADTFGGHAWDAMQMIAGALRKSGSDPEKLRTAIERTVRFVGTGGVFTYSPTDHDGLKKNAAVMLTIEKGQWKLLKK